MMAQQMIVEKSVINMFKMTKELKLFIKKIVDLQIQEIFGIENAKGNLITFVDSDDELENVDLYAKIIYNMKRDLVDIACFGYKKINDNNEIIEKINVDNDRFLIQNQKFSLLYQGAFYTFACVMWNKIFKKEIFENIRFPSKKINEDEYIMHELFFMAHKIGLYSDEVYYLYKQRENSITKRYNKKRLDGIVALKKRIEFIIKNNLPNEFYQQTVNLLLYNIIQHYRSIEIYYSGKDKIRIQNDLNKEFKTYYESLKLKDIRIQNKIKFIMFRINPNFTTKVLNVFFKI